MTELFRSRLTLFIGMVAGGLLVLGSLLALVGIAILSRADAGATANLLTASYWVRFVGWLTGLVAVVSLIWTFILAQRFKSLWELVGVGLFTLFVALGALLQAIETQGSASAGSDLISVGYGTLALIAIAVALQKSMSYNNGTLPTSQAPYWLVAAGSLILITVAQGLGSGSLQSTSAVVASILGAVGFGGLVVTLGVARARDQLKSKSFGTVATGLTIFGLGLIASAIYSIPGNGVTAFKTTFIVSAGLAAVAMALLILSAWIRIGEIGDQTSGSEAYSQASSSSAARGEPQPRPDYNTPGNGNLAHRLHTDVAATKPQSNPSSVGDLASATDASRRKYCSYCGAELEVDASFCWSCGRPVTR
ncbi:zinc ribbon domain-containing protein [Ferrimicrobium sp.]|uniref:zinc ribbon domain-containing protein n=1 Tax=Ferrimicrobium sp. TaxID=2926050 RepID=UPI00262B1083|nr:zinc ribbon domain-containing protein [Ferrimicrobium sp.]